MSIPYMFMNTSYKAFKKKDKRNLIFDQWLPKLLVGHNTYEIII